MALYIGKDLVSASSGLGGATIKNQDKNITENGSYSADSGYTGLGIVKVDVQPKNQDKNITANGTYRADSGYTGLGEVTVEVPPTPPNNQDLTIKENGTYTADEGYTGLGTVTVDVPTGGGASVSPKDVNFYDYDGTILHAYSVEEAQSLTELPELPSHDGLICQGWNWTLDDIKAHNRALNVGATYITDDGKTRLYISILAEGRMTVPLCFKQTVANGVTIDWGDGSATETMSILGNVYPSHTYANIGDYVISLDVADGCELSLGNLTNWANDTLPFNNMLQKVEFGNRMPMINTVVFKNCYSLASITIPNSVTRVNNKGTFNSCYSLAFITLPNSVKAVGQESFVDCHSLVAISIPNGVTSIVSGAFKNCYSLASITMPNGSAFSSGSTGSTFYNNYSLTSIFIPNSMTKIDASTFYYCRGMKFYDFTSHTSVPTLANTNAFTGIPSDCEIRVPASLYDEWIAATNWSTYASNIVAV